MCLDSAPTAPVIHAWAFAPHDTGFQFRTGCNNLHLLGLTLYFTYLVPPSSTNPPGFGRDCHGAFEPTFRGIAQRFQVCGGRRLEFTRRTLADQLRAA